MTQAASPPPNPAPDPPLLPRHPTPVARPYRRATVWLVLGLVTLVMALWMLGTPGGLDGKAVAVGYAICHRIPERSFHAHGEPLPLCARCTGIYLGVMTGLLVFAAGGRAQASLLPPRRVLIILGLFIVVLGLDGINSFLHLFPGYTGPYEPTNWLRLITGSLTGLAMISFVLPVFNTTAWARPRYQRNLRSLRELGGLLLVIALVDALVLLENPVILTVFGLISAAGPVVVLVLIWTVAFLSVTRRENTITGWRGLVIPLLAGLAITFMMLGGIDAARFLWTGTWDGFDFNALSGLSG